MGVCLPAESILNIYRRLVSDVTTITILNVFNDWVKFFWNPISSQNVFCTARLKQFYLVEH